MRSAAYELHCRAAADSAVYGHPGFVPGRFAAGHGAAAVAELCAAGVWEPVVGGYRILDQRAVQRCLEVACELRRQETRTRARIREREHWQAVSVPERAEAMVVTSACAACGAPAARVELVAPGQLPAKWKQRPAAVRDSVMRDRGPGQWYLIVDGVACGNGYGSRSTPGRPGGSPRRSGSRCASIRSARPGSTTTRDSARTAACRTARHWHVSQTGYGHCPLGHGKSLDPHWQPAEHPEAMPLDDNPQQLPQAASAPPEREDMDAACYEDLAGRLYGLLIGLSDRLKDDQAQLLHHFIDVGEYGLALEEIAGALARTRSPSPAKNAATCSR